MPIPHIENKNEADFFDLIDILKKNITKIILITLISIMLASIYAFTAKEEWTSSSQVIAPEPVQLGAYIEAERKYYRSQSFELDKDSNNLLPSIRMDEVFNLGKTLENVFRTFSVELNSFNNKLAYLQQSNYYKYLAEEEKSELEKNILLRQLIEKISINSDIGNSAQLNINFTAEDPVNAQKTLQEFINQSNKNALQQLFKNLFERTNERINSLNEFSQNIKKSTEQKRQNQILVLKQAIRVATDADINEYTGKSLVTGNTIIDFNNTDTLFLLGKKYLTSQLNALESSPVIYPVSYYQTLNNIEELKGIFNIEPKGITFKYTRTADVPLTKDKPRKALILTLGALLGGIVACLYVLIQAAGKNRKKFITN